MNRTTKTLASLTKQLQGTMQHGVGGATAHHARQKVVACDIIKDSCNTEVPRV